MSHCADKLPRFRVEEQLDPDQLVSLEQMPLGEWFRDELAARFLDRDEKNDAVRPPRRP